jgi:hypothetical protein
VKQWLFLFLSLVQIAFAELYTLSICAIFKNEAPYFKEWIEYHKLVGVEHFYLYNNGSEDDYLAALQPYIDAGEVTLVNWPNQRTGEWKEQIWAWVYTTQRTSYEHAFQLAKGKSKWIAAIDIDEFIVPVRAKSIPEVLKKYDAHFPAIEIFWRVYGTSGYDKLPEDKLMIEVLNKKSFAHNGLNKSYKSILKPNLYAAFLWPPHHCQYSNGQVPYQADPKELVINHYVNRCKDYFFSTKVKNKETMDNLKLSPKLITAMLETGNDQNDQDRSIHRFVIPLREKMGLQ